MAVDWLIKAISLTSALCHVTSMSASSAVLQDDFTWNVTGCQHQHQEPECDIIAPYRTAEGTCNNLDHPLWGGSFTTELREIPAMYDDGIGRPRQTATNGEPLPGARTVSNVVFKVDGDSPRNERLTLMVMQWGQLIDHEFVATPTIKDTDGSKLNCCETENKNESVCFPIRVPDFDPYFKANHCMNFVRSKPASAENCSTATREQINTATSYIDGSMVYGSSLEETISLRTLEKGKLKTSRHNMLPNTSDTSKCTMAHTGDFCQKAGDARVNVVPSLGWSHTVFMREHNRIATELERYNSHWDDEMIFQETRKIMAAIIQHLNYNEYLPAIFNSDIMEEYNLWSSPSLYNTIYNDSINAGVSNVFAAAAFRFGHSQIPNYQAMMSTQGQMYNKLNVEMTYNTPYFLINAAFDAFNGIARWLCEDVTPLADGLFESGVRNKLFPDDNGNSLDLPAINIQRGRDHGLPSYNYWRELCGLEIGQMSETEAFVLPDHTLEQRIKLQSVYRHVDDIDLYAGAMTETRLINSSVGPTFACLLGRQFQRLKFGDRFWYESEDPVVRFTPVQLNEIKKVSFARLLCDNHAIDRIQQNVFFTQGPDNPKTWCRDIEAINLRAWVSCDEPLQNGRPEFDLSRCTPLVTMNDSSNCQRLFQDTLHVFVSICIYLIFTQIH